MLIQVKFLGPTDYRPSRWKATRSGGSAIVSKGYKDDTIEDAKRAAYALLDKWGVREDWGLLAFCGQTEKGLYIYAAVDQLKNQIEKAESEG